MTLIVFAFETAFLARGRFSEYPAGQLTLLFLGLVALFAFLVYLNALTCPAGIEGGVLDWITDCP